MAIDTNVRNIRVIHSVTGAAFSVEHHRNPALALCSMCGRKEVCETFGRMMGYERENPVRRCDQYMPPLAFRDKRGTDKVFNTFRLGGAWASRVYPGVEVALVDHKSEIFGTAIVRSVYHGAIEDMTLLFGEDNHLLLGKEMKLPDDMLKILRNSYGNMIYLSHDTATVIYLERQ